MKHGRLSLLVWILALVALVLTGCKSATSEPTQTPETAPRGEPTETSEPIAHLPWQAVPGSATPEPTEATCPNGIVTVTMDDWSNTDEAHEAMTEVLTAFEAAHPCIKAQRVGVTSETHHIDRLHQIQSGTASDLIAADSMYIPAYTQAGGLSDLTPFIEADPDFDPEEFFQGVWKSGFYQGVPRGINKDFSTSAIYVNAGLFEKAGIALPQEGWTYDDYLDIALELTLDANGNNAKSPDFDLDSIVQYGTTIPSWEGEYAWFRGFENLLYSFGAHNISPDATTTVGYLNSENAVRAWEFCRDLVHKYHVSPSATDLTAIKDGNLGLFQSGKLAMVGMYWGPWFNEAFNAIPNLKWTVVPLPTGPGGHKGIIMWMGWGINPKTEHPAEAWELLEWLTTEPGQRAFTRRALTEVKSVAVELQRVNDPFWGVFLAETEYIDVLDDAAHPYFDLCVANGPTKDFLLKTWQDGGDQLDIKAELDKLAAEADVCLAAGQ